MSSLYSRIPGFIKGIWRGRKIESYISYSGDDTGILYEYANVLSKLARNEGGVKPIHSMLRTGLYSISYSMQRKVGFS